MTLSKNSGSTIAIIFAKEDLNEFNRCSFPVLGRPVVSYPILAALNASRVDQCFLSTKSENIIQMAKAYKKLQILHRPSECRSVQEEFQRSLNMAITESAKEPVNVVLLLGNSPCILADTIDNAVDVIDSKPGLDSVVSAEKRRAFNAENAFCLLDNGMLKKSAFPEKESFEFFIDGRISVVRTKNLMQLEAPFTEKFAVYGKKVWPLLQGEGVADIDYTWQVPIVERWLSLNGFTDKKTPYPEPLDVMVDLSTGFLGKIPESKKTKFKVFISTVPFGQDDPYSIDILNKEPNCEFVINPIGRKLKEPELVDILKDYDVLIAGTEPLTAKVMDSATSLKLISRVGIGLDNVDLLYARKKGIHVSYTPDAPSPAVAELTIGQILNCCRNIPLVDRKIRDGVWQRYMGRRIANCTIGIVGTGRIGSRILKHLQGFSPTRILVNDIKPDQNLYELFNAEFVSKETLFRDSDIITFHVPLNPETYNLISKKEIDLMKQDVILINTARGGIINEKDLYYALKNKRIAAAAIDVFENEPYGGELVTLDNCFMTCHMGSCSTDCRFEMEKFATEEAIRFINGQELILSVPEEEYEFRKAMNK